MRWSRLKKKEDNVCDFVFDKKVGRIGQMLVGNLCLEDETTLFQFLWDIESVVQIDKSDPIGCAKDTQFTIEIIEGSKPVCHDVRRCSRLKQLFIDNEIDKLLK